MPGNMQEPKKYGTFESRDRVGGWEVVERVTCNCGRSCPITYGLGLTSHMGNKAIGLGLRWACFGSSPEVCLLSSDQLTAPRASPEQKSCIIRWKLLCSKCSLIYQLHWNKFAFSKQALYENWLSLIYMTVGRMKGDDPYKAFSAKPGT